MQWLRASCFPLARLRLVRLGQRSNAEGGHGGPPLQLVVHRGRTMMFFSDSVLRRTNSSVNRREID